jgi:hypothetical protein
MTCLAPVEEAMRGTVHKMQLMQAVPMPNYDDYETCSLTAV